jgi:hypothetical protein
MTRRVRNPSPAQVSPPTATCCADWLSRIMSDAQLRESLEQTQFSTRLQWALSSMCGATVPSRICERHEILVQR